MEGERRKVEVEQQARHCEVRSNLYFSVLPKDCFVPRKDELAADELMISEPKLAR